MCFVRTKGLAVRLTKTESSPESNSTTASDETEHHNEGLTNIENIATKEDSYFYNFHFARELEVHAKRLAHQCWMSTQNSK